MSARLLTGDEKLAYVRQRNAALDAVRGIQGNPEAEGLPRYEVHLMRVVVRDGVQGYETAIIIGDDRREVGELALRQDYPSRTLYDAPKDLAYLGWVGRYQSLRPQSANSIGAAA